MGDRLQTYHIDAVFGTWFVGVQCTRHYERRAGRHKRKCQICGGWRCFGTAYVVSMYRRSTWMPRRAGWSTMLCCQRMSPVCRIAWRRHMLGDREAACPLHGYFALSRPAESVLHRPGDPHFQNAHEDVTLASWPSEQQASKASHCCGRDATCQHRRFSLSRSKRGGHKPFTDVMALPGLRPETSPHANCWIASTTAEVLGQGLGICSTR